MTNKPHKNALFIFRRDLRIEDNIGLNFAHKLADTVIPAFIFTKEQIDENEYKSDHCLKFMLESLIDLNDSIKKHSSKLYLFKGKPEEIVAECIKKLNVDLVVVNRDYTPYSIKRDELIEKACQSAKVSFYSFHDILLNEPENTLKTDGKPYTIFTPYFKNALKMPPEEPKTVKDYAFFKGPIDFSIEGIIDTLMPKVYTSLKGGRKEALKILNKLDSLMQYALLRDFPANNCISHLSPYLKFNVCSIREVYYAIGNKLLLSHDLIRSLYWRDFFTHIAYFFPHVFKGSFNKKYQDIQWEYDEKKFKRWCEGTTGFPIVDAGMREMNETGFMHNRVRMVVGSFLVKDLHLPWQWGEKYFANKLIDYDPAVNNGNWQWVASTGCDAQPYFRIFNPWNQQKKFDPECIYIKKWVKELKNFHPKVIHAWNDPKNYNQTMEYCPPMVEHDKEAKKALDLYRSS